MKAKPWKKPFKVTARETFRNEEIKRDDLPQDVLSILKHLASVYLRDVGFIGYLRENARNALRRKGREYVWPLQQTWLIDTLSKAYDDRVFVLGIIGDIARLIRQRQKEKLGASNTTCIACGGPIPKEREERGQHTCSEPCQRWYRRLMRAIHAGKECRYCGHGLPKDRQKWPKQRRPGRPRGLRQPQEIEPSKTPGSASHSSLKLIPIGHSVPLIPRGKEGVEPGQLAEALEDLK